MTFCFPNRCSPPQRTSKAISTARICRPLPQRLLHLCLQSRQRLQADLEAAACSMHLFGPLVTAGGCLQLSLSQGPSEVSVMGNDRLSWPQFTRAVRVSRARVIEHAAGRQWAGRRAGGWAAAPRCTRELYLCLRHLLVWMSFPVAQWVFLGR